MSGGGDAPTTRGSGLEPLSELHPSSEGAWSSWGFVEGGITYYDGPSGTAGADTALGDIHELPGPLTILDWGPVGEIPAENRRPRIFLTFSHPMISLGKLGEVMTSSDVMIIDPPLPGVYRWYGSRTITFQPDAPLQGQQPLEIRVNPRAVSLGGTALDSGSEEFSFQIFKERLSIAAAYPGNPGQTIDPEQIPMDQRTFTLLFNGPIDPVHIQSFLQVDFDAPGTRQISFSTKHPTLEQVGGDENLRSRSILVTLEEDLPENSPVSITLQTGATAFPEYMPTLEDQVFMFHSLTPFAYQEHKAQSYAFPKSEDGDSNPIFIEFTHDIDRESVDGRIKVDLEVQDLAEHTQVFRNMIRLNNLPVEYESTYRITLDAGIRDVYGRTLGEEQQLTVEIPRAARFYYFPDRGVRMLEAQFAPKIIFEHQNMESGLWRIGPISSPFNVFTEDSLEPYDFSEIPENTRWFDVKDLTPYLNESGTGWVGVSWNFAEPQNGKRPRWAKNDLTIQVTDLGLTLRYAYNQALVWVRSLTDNQPVSGAEVSLINSNRNNNFGNVSTTDQNGLAVIPLEAGEFSRRYTDRYGREDIIVRVEKDQDRVEFKPNNSHNLWAQGIRSTVSPQDAEDNTRATFLFSDRGLYKPGETLTFRGIDRDQILGTYQAYQGGYSLKLVSSDWRVQTPLYSSQGRTTKNGGVYGTALIDEDIEPGLYYLEYSRSGSGTYDRERVPIQIAFFRRAAFQVEVNPPALEVIVGDKAGFGISADLLSGGAMAGAGYSFDITRTPVMYYPPGNRWDGYVFGPQDGFTGGGVVRHGSGNLDGAGRAVEEVVTSSQGAAPGMALQYRLEARVQDAASQELAGRESFVAHPASVYAALGLKGRSASYWGGYFIQAGETLEIESALVTPDGEVAVDFPGDDDSFTLEVSRISWKMVQQQGVNGRLNTRYEREEEVVDSRSMNFSRGQGHLSLKLEDSGSYMISLWGRDSQSRPVLTQMSLYVSGATYTRWWGNDAQAIQLLPDRQEYHVGDTARVFLQTPLPQGTYLMTLEREGIQEHSFITLQGSQQVLEIPITEAHLPVIYLTISSASQRQETPKSYFEPDLGKPKGYFGAVALFVNPEPRRFDIEINPSQPSYQPGEQAEIELLVRKNGEPLAGAEVTLMAVDRGVVDLIDYRVPDPVAFFYDPSRFPLGGRGADSRSILMDPVTYEVKNLQGGDSGDDKLEERKDFRPTAFFEPYLVSDSQGRIRVSFDLPDSLTTYRLTAVGVKDDTFALREDEVLVTNPVTMRASLPRLLRERDTARTGVVVTNLTGEVQEITVDLSLEGNSIALDSPDGVTAALAAGESREFSYQVAAMAEGTSDLIFTLEAVSMNAQNPGNPADGDSRASQPKGFQDRLRTTLRVERPLTPETVSVFGSLQGQASEAIALPSNAARGFGELRLQVHGTRLYQISKAVADLDGLWHQNVSSRVLSMTPSLVLGQGLESLTGRTPKSAEQIQRFLRDLKVSQHQDGGFVEFVDHIHRYETSSITTTLRVASFLSEAALRGYDLETLSQNLPKLVNRLDSYVQDEDNSPSFRAHALYCRSVLHKPDVSSAQNLLGLGDELGMDGLGFIALSVLQGDSNAGSSDIANTAYRRMMNFVTISPRGADFRETYESRSYFDAPARRLGLLYRLIQYLGTGADHLDRIAHTMVQEVGSGQWRSREDLLWVLTTLAPRPQLSPEDEVQEGQGTSTARITAEIGEITLLEDQELSLLDPPLETKYDLFEGPLGEVPRNTLLPLNLYSQEDDPPVHYAATLTYALPDEVIPPRDEGIGVSAWVEDLDGTPVDWKDLVRGKTYRLNTTLETTSRYYNLALRIPLPSGAEVLDSSLTTTGEYTADGGVDTREWTRETVYGDSQTYTEEGYMGLGAGGWWRYAIQPVKRIYDGEVHFYFGSVYEGSQTVGFLFRAVTPGIYPTAPIQAELMDEPEVFGRTGGVLTVIQ